MDSEKLAGMLDYLREQDQFNIHNLLIIRNGYVVTDAYFYPFAEGWLHDLASVTKSFTSSLIGIAIEEGHIDSVQQPVFDLFPGHSAANVDANKEAITVEDLLTMSSGFECINYPVEATLSEMMASPDWVQFTLDLPMAEEPGTHWVYCSPNTHLLSAIIRETSGMSALELAQESLFAPLGISDVIWPPDPQGNTHGWGDLIMTPRDMAKLGFLYLQQGEWDGQQVLPPDWVAAATNSSMSLPSSAAAEEYGYSWWLNPSDSYYYADGRGGQRIFVFPDLEMIVVTTGGGGPDQYGVLDTLLTSHILPAAEADAPQPPNPDGVAMLESGLQQVALPQTEPEAQPVPPMPEIAQQVSGQTYVLDANPLGLHTVSLTFGEEAEASLNVAFLDGNQVEWQIGLDNVFRFSPGTFGLIAAAKGEWESDNTFAITLDEIGRINQMDVTMIFEDDQMILRVLGATLVGRLEE